MPQIELLSQETIDKIAAGEVVERPSSVVKELVENAIDAGASAVTAEIKEGGISLIRISDNGCGIEKEQIPLAFLRHSTSKIRSVEDLMSVTSLGFRGEALSSIAAVSQVELITKTSADFTGTRYQIEGSKECGCEEIGAPDGTTFLVRNLFYNTPARKKFLKSAQTEGSYIHDLMQHMALSHPDVAFKLIINNQIKLQTSGNGNVKDIIYHLYGRDITRSLLEVRHETPLFTVEGFIGKPNISRGNRNYEVYFVNGRFIKSQVIARAIEEAYKPFLMQHQYPLTVLYLTIDSSQLDINVHPTKMELRFSRQQEIYQQLTEALGKDLKNRDMIPQVPVQEKPAERGADQIVSGPIMPEPFEHRRLEQVLQAVRRDSPYEKKYVPPVEPKGSAASQIREENTYGTYEQTSFLSRQEMAKHKIIGQLFDTYWLVEYEDKLFIVDQHAAHEKVLYERMRRQLAEKELTSQAVSPPIVMTLSVREAETLKHYLPQFTDLGFVIEHFGGMEYSICGVPGNLYKIDPCDILQEMLGELTQDIHSDSAPEVILDKLASMSCKAAIKGNQRISLPEMERLMQELMELENPYNCPHGRPTIISMSKYDIEKKFKRVL
ncbi:MAG: DNA mismatch repair endonuclease MutL [Lachnospiraceae bacterium]|nr:DNA mismatch repair endonuclease MutL [Lachnospiraceae bacterium]